MVQVEPMKDGIETCAKIGKEPQTAYDGWYVPPRQP
jgi:hypothetical protein